MYTIFFMPIPLIKYTVSFIFNLVCNIYIYFNHSYNGHTIVYFIYNLNV